MLESLGAFIAHVPVYVALVVPYLVLYAPNFIGFSLPPVIQYINKDVIPEKERFIVTVFVCFLAAVLLNIKDIYYNLSYQTAGDVFGALMFVFGQSQIVYRLYFKNSQLKVKIDNVIEEQKINETKESEVVPVETVVVPVTEAI